MFSSDNPRRSFARSAVRMIPVVLLFSAGTTAVALFATPSSGQAAAASAETNDSARYTIKVPDGLKVPGGLAFGEGKGWEDWAVIASHHTDKVVEAIVGNPVAMKAFRTGIPVNGKPFPDGSKLAKVIWSSKRSADAPYDVKVPAAVSAVEFMVKDLKRFPDSGGWGYAVFWQDTASGTYRPGTLTDNPPQANDAKCGAGCHTIARGKDFVFTEYTKR